MNKKVFVLLLVAVASIAGDLDAKGGRGGTTVIVNNGGGGRGRWYGRGYWGRPYYSDWVAPAVVGVGFGALATAAVINSNDNTNRKADERRADMDREQARRAAYVRRLERNLNRMLDRQRGLQRDLDKLDVKENLTAHDEVVMSRIKNKLADLNDQIRLIEDQIEEASRP